MQLDAQPAADRGHSPVRTDHQPAALLVNDVVMLVAHHRRVTQLEINFPDTADDGRAGCFCSLVQRLAGLGVTHVQDTRHTGQDSVQRGHGCLRLRWVGHLVVGHRPRHVAAARVQQCLLQVEPEQLGYAPADHPLAAHLVPIGGLTFQYDDLVAVPGHHGGQRRPGDPTTHDDYINRFAHLCFPTCWVTVDSAPVPRVLPFAPPHWATLRILRCHDKVESPNLNHQIH
jgi:hypothetical protein